MSGIFPNTTRFASVTTRSDTNQMTTIDANNKLFSIIQNTSLAPSGLTYNLKGVKHAWEFDFTTVPLTRTEMGPIYSFLCAQNGSAETFTITPPATAHRYVKDTLTTRTFTFNPALSEGDVGIMTYVESNENSVDYANDDGVTTLNNGDFIKFSNHDKVYLWRTLMSVYCANFNPDLGSLTQNGYFYPPLQQDVPSGTTFTWDPEFRVALLGEPQVVETDQDGTFQISFSVREESNA